MLAVATTGGSAAIVVLLSAIVGKIVATVLGPAGTGLYGQLGQIVLLASELATVAGGTALVQGIATRSGLNRDRYIVTTFLLYLSGSVLASLVLVVLSPQIANAALGQIEPRFVVLVRWLSIVVFLNASLLFLTRVLNGFRAVGKYALVQVIHALVAAVAAYPVASLVSKGSTSAFLALLILPLVVAGTCAFYFAYARGWIRPIFQVFAWRIDRDAAKHFLSISSSTLVTSLVGSGVLLLVRSLAVQWMGLRGAGIFGAAWALSMAYASLLLRSFGVYYLPTLGRAKDTAEKTEIISNSLRLSIILSVPLIVAIVSLKPLMIALFYSEEFLSSLEMVRWMLIGDYFKISAYTLATLVLAFPDMRTFLLVELLWNLGFAAMSPLTIIFSGRLEGVGVVFLLLYAFYFAFYSYYAYSKHQIRFPPNLVRAWLMGLLLIGIASIYNWHNVTVDWGATLACVILALVLSWYALGRVYRSKLHLLIRNRLAGAGKWRI
jgi:O-antigen/teichoic acid export membrane protein